MFCCGGSTKEDLSQRQKLLQPKPASVEYWSVVPAATSGEEYESPNVSANDGTLIKAENVYSIEIGNTMITEEQFRRDCKVLQFPVQQNFTTLFPEQGVETRGGETQIGWVLISFVRLDGESLLMVRDVYSNALHRSEKSMSMEAFLDEIKYPIDFYRLSLVSCSTDDLLKLDEILVRPNYKFGVIYCKEGQGTELEWLSNETGSERFTRFLDILGDKIELQGWEKYRAGLNVKDNSSGSHSHFTNSHQHNIMFHISTLLPHQHDNEQQIAKKRFIGNDIVVILFKEGNEAISTVTRSQFNHIFIVVQEDEEREGNYKVEVARNTSVKPFGPLLPESSSVPADLLQEFICCKALNGEWATYRSKQFKKRLGSARTMQIEQFIEEHSK